MAEEVNIGAIREYSIGYTKYYYEVYPESISEFEKDVQVREQLWKTLVGDIVLDVGAGFGSYTLTALANAAGFVFAFENDINKLVIIRRNLQNNRALMATERATICKWKLDDSDKTVDRFLSELSYPVTRLDWIKVDVGSIPDTRVVLWGIKETIKKFRPYILIADPEPPQYSFLEKYNQIKIVDGHSLLAPIR